MGRSHLTERQRQNLVCSRGTPEGRARRRVVKSAGHRPGPGPGQRCPNGRPRRTDPRRQHTARSQPDDLARPVLPSGLKPCPSEGARRPPRPPTCPDGPEPGADRRGSDAAPARRAGDGLSPRGPGRTQGRARGGPRSRALRRPGRSRRPLPPSGLLPAPAQ